MTKSRWSTPLCSRPSTPSRWETGPEGIAISPDGSRLYVANLLGSTVSIIDTASSTVVIHLGLGMNPLGLAVTPDGGQVYVANTSSDSVSVIDTGSNMVVDTIAVGDGPTAFGSFIASLPPEIFADGFEPGDTSAW